MKAVNGFWMNREPIKALIATFLFPTLLFCSALKGSIGPNNLIYAIGQIHEYDSSFFKSNVFLADTSVSPRYILDRIFSVLMHLTGGNWQNVAVPFLYLGVLMLGIAIASLTCYLSQNNRAYLAFVLALMFAADVCDQVGGFGLFEVESIGMGMGFSFVILAISFVAGENKKFNYAWSFIAIASCIHIHEGIYGFATVFIILTADFLYKKRIRIKDIWMVVISVSAILIVTVPNIITDHLNISNEEFVYIYAACRHPHHLRPSSWDRKEILLSLLFVILSALVRYTYLYFKQLREDRNAFFIEAFLFLTAWIGAFTVMYIGTEQLKSATVVTVFIVKFFKYAGLMAVIWYVKTIIDLWDQQSYMLGLGVLVFAFSARRLGYEALFFCFMLLLWMYWSLKKNPEESPKRPKCILLLEGTIFGIIIMKCSTSLSKDVKNVATLMVLFFISRYLWKKYRQKVYQSVSVILCTVLILISLYGDVYEISDHKFVFKTPTTFLVNACGSDIYELANDFRNLTENTEEYLASPKDTEGAGWFQVIARRNCYVLNKVIPSSKSRVKEWYDRYQLTQGLFDKPIAEIEKIMGDVNIDYILVNQKYYEMFHENANFNLYVDCTNDTYRIYKRIPQNVFCSF